MPSEVEKLLAVLAADPTLPAYEEPAPQAPKASSWSKTSGVFVKVDVARRQKPVREPRRS